MEAFIHYYFPQVNTDKLNLEDLKSIYEEAIFIDEHVKSMLKNAFWGEKK